MKDKQLIKDALYQILNNLDVILNYLPDLNKSTKENLHIDNSYYLKKLKKYI